MATLATARDDWTPNWVTHPGEHLAEHLEARGWSQAEFARLASLSPKLVSTIISGANPVSADTAIKLERVLGVKAYIWTSLQANWDLFRARAQAKPGIEARSWLSLFPIQELRERSWLPQTKNEKELLDSLLHLFQIGTPEAYPARVRALAVHHRRSRAYESSEHNVFTWLMLGENRARRMNVPAFHARKFEDAVRKIRALTVEQPSVFESRMKMLCHEAGVALVLEPAISKTCLYGSARWFDGDRGIIQMSLRMKTNDHFWWTFFHEAAHIILHPGRNFIDDQNGVGDGLEEEADRWAAEILLGQRGIKHLKALRPRSKAAVKRVADQIGLHPGIVVGVLQHAHLLPFSHLNGLKEKFEWVRERPAA
jgi:HTH-type transcriptional regulator / antitoxin HigA